MPRQREGDQPQPVVNSGPCVQDLVLIDLEARKAVGIERYGTVLQPHNGRDTLRDAYEEALDLACYLRQAIYERDHPQQAPRFLLSGYDCGHPACSKSHPSKHEVC